MTEDRLPRRCWRLNYRNGFRDRTLAPTTC